MPQLPDLAQIASLRRRLSITQRRLAIESGVSQSLISRIESGTVAPTYYNAKMIIDALERLEDGFQETKRRPSNQRTVDAIGKAAAKRFIPALQKIRNCTRRIGIVDTTFSNIDAGSMAIREIRRLAPKVRIMRYTVPGVRDTPLACKLLIDKRCGIVLVTGMISRRGAEKDVESQAVSGIVNVQLATNRHIITAFFDENEARDKMRLYKIVQDRVIKHAQNALVMLASPESLTDYAGLGIRQGSSNVGRLTI